MIFFSNKKVLSGIALAFIFIPILLMGIFGSWSISSLEGEADLFHREAFNQALKLNQKASKLLQSSFPTLLQENQEHEPVKEQKPAPQANEEASAHHESFPAKESPHEDALEENPQPKAQDLQKAFELQKHYLIRETQSFGLAALTFRGSERVHTETGNTQITDIHTKDWQDAIFQHASELFASGASHGYYLEATFRKGLYAHSFFYLDLKNLKDLEKDHWTVWLVNTRRLEQFLRDEARKIKSSQPLVFEVIQKTESKNTPDAMPFFLDLDQESLPLWSLKIDLKKSQFLIGHAWRSRFYIAIAFLTLPLLASVIWLIANGVKREIHEARKKVDFVANVTHELKTPLTSIRMFIETLLLGRTRSEEETRQSLEIVLRESERLTRLIDRVLEFNKLEHHQKVFSFQLENIATIVRETVAIFRKQMGPELEHQIKLVIQAGLPRLSVDRDALREVLLNLLSNAVKYSGPQKPVNVRLHREGKWILIDIIDRGRGISPEFHDKIFDKFYRVSDELNRQVEGTGLGLTLSLAIAKAHNGNIEVYSSPGQGSRFTVKLPLPPAGEESTQLLPGVKIPRYKNKK